MFTSTQWRPWRRGTFAELIRHARENAGLPGSIKAVQSALGHKNASETLDTYSHLWPADEDRLRDAVQALHCPPRVTHVSRASGATL